MFADPRRRNLAIFLGIVVLVMLAAWIGLRREAAQVAPKYGETEFLPGFAARVREAGRIHIVSKKHGAFDIVFKPNKGWVVPSKSDYPASFEVVNKTLVTLATLETIEPKTARTDWLHYIALDAPPQGDGVQITVHGDRGRILADVIAGKSEDIGDSGGAVGLFVRRPGEAQSWLVRAQSVPPSDPFDWLDKTIADIDTTRIIKTVVDLPSGQSFEVARATRREPDFHLTAMPPGRELAGASAADGIATAVSDLTFDDVRPAKDLDFSGAVRTVTKTFDGMSITSDVVKIGTEYWAQFGAMSLVADPAIGREARGFNARVSGWAYRLPDYKGAAFMTTLDSILKPKGGKPAAAP
ncbi:MAG TPA: DUF4340 domain-containing protein [Rhizomicrobium sp.]|nr:DUF4340 domain-containing protein [Rhizomicrobium sp.]